MNFKEYGNTSKQCGNNTFSYFKLPSLMGTDDIDYVWLICAFLVLVGNISVLVWRCTRRSDQRNSVPSILIINLATADLLLGIQMLLYLLLTAWPCSVFDHKTVVTVFCNVSAWLQMVSTMMSAVTTTTIAFYFIISLTCSHCSRKCMIALLLSEWILSFCVCYILTHLFGIDSFYLFYFDSSQCLPVLATGPIYEGVIVSLLLIALIVYIVLLIKIRQQGNRSGASVSVAQIQLIFIAFASFILWGMCLLIPYLLRLDIEKGLYYEQICIAGVAISNPLVFTLLSKPFFKSAKSVWECFCYKCGHPTQLDQIYSSEEERDPLLTRVASQTNYSSSFQNLSLNNS